MTLPLYHATGGALQRKGRPNRATPAPGPVERPTGAGYVSYETLYVSGNTLRQVFAKVSGTHAGKVLTFPEGEFTFSDFADPTGYFDGIRVPTTCKGIWGSGRNTVFKMLPGTSTRGSNTEAVPPTTAVGTANQCFLLRTDFVTNAILKNFTLQGTEQGHPYNGLMFWECNAPTVEGLYLRGASRGYANFPPGETMGISINGSPNASILDTEIDGRDEGGTRVSASPFGWNNTSGAYVRDVYAHHSKAGMPTFYNTNGVHTVRLRSEYNGSGPDPVSGQGINHENVTGAVLHESPTLIVDGAGGNPGLHISLLNGVADNPNVTLTNVTHDAGPTAGCLSVALYANYVDPDGRPQKQVSLPIVTKNGVTLTHRPWSESGHNPNLHFVSY